MSTPELLGARGVAALLGISRSETYAADRAGLLPAPVSLNSEKKWRTRELLDWVDAALPARAEWRWRPSLPARLDDLIALRTKQLSELARDIAELESRRAAGEANAHVSKGI